MDFTYYIDLFAPYLDQALTPKTLIILAALSGSLAIMLLSRDIDFALALTPQAGRTVMRYRGASESSTLDELGGRALKRLPVLGTLFGLEDNRRWLALKSPPPSVPAIVGLALLLGAGGLLFAALMLKPFLGLLAVVGFLYPFMRLRSQASQVRRRMERSLPEITAILAAEMAAGLPPDQALERASGWTGPMAALLRGVIVASRRSGHPVFGRGPSAGTLVRTTEPYDLPALQAFATQVDTAARKGAAGPELMHALVQTYIVSYQDRSLQEAEKLETRLAVPSVFFFFMPLLFLILVPMLIPLLRIM
jgi:Flp pilus assembly protein TadB